MYLGLHWGVDAIMNLALKELSTVTFKSWKPEWTLETLSALKFVFVS